MLNLKRISDIWFVVQDGKVICISKNLSNALYFIFEVRR